MIDDATAAYILETRKPFEDLRQVVAQLGGLLLLQAAPDHPLLAQARAMHREAVAALSRAASNDRAEQHRQHLGRAAALLGTALTHGMNASTALPPLRAAYDCLQAASRTLPGFEMVAFEQGCCSVLR